MLSKTQKLLLFSQFIQVSLAGKCPFGFGSSEDEPEEHVAPPKLDDLATMSDPEDNVRRVLQAESVALYPADILTCPNDEKVLTTLDHFSNDEYEAVVESVNELYDDTEDKAGFAGCLLRLAGHDLMDFRYSYGTKKDGTMDKKPDNYVGGSDGCINFGDKENKGLAECVKNFDLNSAYSEHCGVVSLADFMVIAAEAVMGRTAKSYDENDEYGTDTLAKVFRDQFKAGRTTVEQCGENIDLMPDPERGCTDNEMIFGDNIFKFQTKSERKELIAALLGAHTLGSAKIHNSGYHGSWSSKGSKGVFDNDYYRMMLTRGWGPDLAIGGNTERNQWKVIDIADDGQPLMMLNSDLCLAYDNNAVHQDCMEENNFDTKACKGARNEGQPINALETKCCAWTHKNALFKNGVFDLEGEGNLCGHVTTKKDKETDFLGMRESCCADEDDASTGDCDSADWPKGPSFNEVLAFAADENLWLTQYAKAWKIATENGHLGLRALEEAPATEPIDDCHKLPSKKLCQKESKCSWEENGELNKRGKEKKHCIFSIKA